MRFLSSLMDFFYPRPCIHCKESLMHQERFFCLHCFRYLPYTYNWLLNDNITEQVFWGRINFQRAFSYLYYLKDGMAQNIIHEIKYKGNKELGDYFGYKFGLEIKENAEIKADYIVPVPLHPKKMKRRGFNQSEIIAKGLSNALDAEVVIDNLIRIEYQDSQTRKSRYDRFKNVTDIFEVLNPEQLNGKHILLLDDVVTTGSTIEACVTAIHKFADCKVSIASLAIAAL